MTYHAGGTFDVTLSPGNSTEPMISRMVINKQFHGDLEANSTGEMLSTGNPSKGSAGYVALERVSGKLRGRSGSFVLQHTGTVDSGESHLSVAIVPGSGTDELQGIRGEMRITIDSGKHLYALDYTLPPQPR